MGEALDLIDSQMTGAAMAERLRSLEEKCLYNQVAILSHIRNEMIDVECIKEMCHEFNIEPTKRMILFCYSLMVKATEKRHVPGQNGLSRQMD